MYNGCVNKIEWKLRALKQLKKIPKNCRQAIVEAVDTLGAERDQWVNVKPLRGHNTAYRMRVGRYRVLFDYEEQIRIITIEEVKKRDERTY
ncbi:MAG TPA: type II toxin-antitoxin system RelE/ParE family toxin [Geoalkalibacter subterraneus]|uniref:Type II toxin-antitoxin system RelE/ParE family toxin n=1 Tax=Geoalkalibacter subterraneus TaxID=483547 RepID=A0A831LET3_9BACT|nr:type II toxin-antitoxin system RelE/ParE family toxin [Geoalkalibacter subterraneus]